MAMSCQYPGNGYMYPSCALMYPSRTHHVPITCPHVPITCPHVPIMCPLHAPSLSLVCYVLWCSDLPTGRCEATDADEGDNGAHVPLRLYPACSGHHRKNGRCPRTVQGSPAESAQGGPLGGHCLCDVRSCQDTLGVRQRLARQCSSFRNQLSQFHLTCSHALFFKIIK